MLFNIPEGNLKESPTSYMSMTNQKLTSVAVAEEAAKVTTEAKKDKPAAAKPAPAAASKQAPAPVAASSGGSEAELNQKIKEVGDKVRDLKTNKAAKVGSTKTCSITVKILTLRP